MHQNLIQLGRKIVNELHKRDLNNSINLLEGFIEKLEEKEDPTANELELANEIYRFFEQYKILEQTFKSYTTSHSSNPQGDKLAELLKARERRF